MDSLKHLFPRDDNSATLSLMSILLIVFLSLTLVGILAAGALCLLRAIRRRRAAKSQELPFHNKQTRKSNHRRLTITASPYGRNSPSISISEKQAFMNYHSDSPPSSPVPEIRITFPEEVDQGGKRQSRVVVVRIGEKGEVGLEPYEEEQLPAYQQREGDGFKSLDLERMGGLKEKDYSG